MKRLFLVPALVIAWAIPVPVSAAGCDGVTVVVDFRGLGGGVQQGCAPGSPASGVAALAAAGFGYTYASRQPGFVCRINEKPGADADRCVTTSPASAYWSYWHAAPGGSWSYSSQGAATYAPARGTVEGWAFGAGEQPGMAPPAAPAPPPPAPGLPAPKPPVGQPPAQQPPAVTTTTAPPASASAPASSPSSAPSSTTSSSVPESSSAVAEVKPLRAEEETSQGWVWTAAGVLVIAVLVVVGLVVARRRRSAEDE